MSSRLSPRAGPRTRISPFDSDSFSSVISVSSSDSESEDIEAMSSVAPSPPPLLQSDTSVAPTATEASLIEKHAEHFHPGGDVKFLVGRTLYQLHGDVLARQSGWFRTYRDMANDNGMLPSGWQAQPGPFCTVYVHHGKQVVQFERPGALNEETGAIVVDNMTTWAMDAFMAVLYPTDYMSFGLSGQDEWTAVLKVAHLWDCTAVRTLAIDRLGRALGDLGSTAKAFDRLVLARKYAVEAWTKPALESLVARDAPLDAEEIEQMLPEDVAHVAALREDRALRKASPPLTLCSPAPLPMTPLPGLSSESVETAVGEGPTAASPATCVSLEPVSVAWPSPSASPPSPQTPSSPGLSILRPPSPPAIYSPPRSTSSRASSPFEYSSRPASPLGPWTPRPAPSPPRAWSITPASSQSRAGTPVNVPSPHHERTIPPPLFQPARLWSVTPAPGPPHPPTPPSPPPVQVPPPAPSSPQASPLAPRPPVMRPAVAAQPPSPKYSPGSAAPYGGPTISTNADARSAWAHSGWVPPTRNWTMPPTPPTPPSASSWRVMPPHPLQPSRPSPSQSSRPPLPQRSPQVSRPPPPVPISVNTLF